MIDPRTVLTVKHDDDSSFADYSEKAKDYLRDTFTIELIAAEDYLYLGYTKPFGSAYVELETPNVNANSLTAEYWDGATWQSMDLTDETEGFTRSGYLMWDKEQMVDGETVAVDSDDKYWFRIRPDADQSSTVFRGINLVFADDATLKQEFFEIDNTNMLPPGESSHISVHVASRNYIIQKLRNLGYIKDDSTSGDMIINQWDLMDMFEIRQAAVYLALSKIFFNLSDDPEDHWWAKYRDYQDKFESVKWPAQLTVDIDNDGETDPDEQAAPIKVVRWRR